MGWLWGVKAINILRAFSVEDIFTAGRVIIIPVLPLAERFLAKTLNPKQWQRPIYRNSVQHIATSPLVAQAPRKFNPKSA
jgi:hypothetical protein